MQLFFISLLYRNHIIVEYDVTASRRLSVNIDVQTNVKNVVLTAANVE